MMQNKGPTAHSIIPQFFPLFLSSYFFIRLLLFSNPCLHVYQEFSITVLYPSLPASSSYVALHVDTLWITFLSLISPSFYSDRPSAMTNLTHHARPGSGAGLGRVEWLIPLAVVSALTFFCLVVLLAVLIYWRCVQQQHYFLFLSWWLLEC